jgi:hypothetical protein
VIELGFLDGIVPTEDRNQRGGGGLWMESASGGEFGAWCEDASDDHGDGQISLGALGAGEDRFQAKAAQSAESGGDMAVGSRALNLESVRGGDEGIAFEDAAEGVDLTGGPSRKVGESAFDDLTAVTRGLAEEDGGRGVAVRNGLHVHGPTISLIIHLNKNNICIYMGTHCKP